MQSPISINRWHWLNSFTIFIFVINFRLANIIHVYTTMSSQALFPFESFSAMIALKSLLLVVGYFVPSQITH